MEADTLASSKKNAAKQGRIIVFIDESGLSERPTRVRTWAPRGETPVLQYHFNWHQLSVIAGITFRRFYFRLFPGAIKSPQIIEFLNALGRQIRKPLLVIWDGLPAHRSALVREYLEALKGAIQIEQLPAYAPELQPHGVHLGSSQAPRTRQSLRRGLRRSENRCSQPPTFHAASPDLDPCFLASS
jgi:hypothetical protein